MSTDIVLIIQGYQIANLGSSNIYTDLNGKIVNKDQLETLHDQGLDHIISEIQMLAAYTPKSLEELEGLKSKVADLIIKFSEERLKLGKQFTLATLLEDKEINYTIK